MGAEAGRRVRRIRDPLHIHRAHVRHRPMHARLDGFDLHAAVAVAADDREGLESHHWRRGALLERRGGTASGCVRCRTREQAPVPERRPGSTSSSGAPHGQPGDPRSYEAACALQTVRLGLDADPFGNQHDGEREASRRQGRPNIGKVNPHQNRPHKRHLGLSSLDPPRQQIACHTKSACRVM